jgi:hypothetical protein
MPPEQLVRSERKSAMAREEQMEFGEGESRARRRARVE